LVFKNAPAPILCRDDVNSNFVSNFAPKKARSPIILTVLMASFIELSAFPEKLEQFSKQLLGISTISTLNSLIYFKFKQFRNASGPIYLISAPNSIPYKEEQSLNAASPIEKTLGNLISSI